MDGRTLQFKVLSARTIPRRFDKFTIPLAGPTTYPSALVFDQNERQAPNRENAEEEV
jgi:hypothetical protein